MCGIGFSVMRPASLAVGSPLRQATKPCAASWKQTASTSAKIWMTIACPPPIRLTSRTPCMVRHPNKHRGNRQTRALPMTVEGGSQTGPDARHWISAGGDSGVSRARGAQPHGSARRNASLGSTAPPGADGPFSAAEWMVRAHPGELVLAGAHAPLELLGEQRREDLAEERPGRVAEREQVAPLELGRDLRPLGEVVADRVGRAAASPCAPRRRPPARAAGARAARAPPTAASGRAASRRFCTCRPSPTSAARRAATRGGTARRAHRSATPRGPRPSQSAAR